MAFHVEDTIAAVASAAGSGARAIIRVSGPRLVSCLEPCVKAECDWKHARRPQVFAAELHDAAYSWRVPCDVYLWPTQRSYTRQPSAELHLINSRPLVELALRALQQFGVRLARPGEFTQRAFLAGRIDLAQAEAVLGVIDAQTTRELNLALTQLAGGLSQPVARLRGQLLDLLADLEAGLDFVDEDIEFVTQAELASRLTDAWHHLRQMIACLEARSVGDRPWQCALIGEPNAGKSSLFNALCGQSAIVAESAGTTRDYLVGQLALTAQLSCHLLDTAGIEPSADAARTDATPAGQLITQQMLTQADLVVACIDGSQRLTQHSRAILAQSQARSHLVVITKTDLPPAFAPEILAEDAVVLVSSVTGVGLDDLRRQIADRLLVNASHESAVLRATSARCHASFASALTAMEVAMHVQREQLGDELVAAELRGVLDELGQIAGTVCTEDLLDRVFSRFCIGK